MLINVLVRWSIHCFLIHVFIIVAIILEKINSDLTNANYLVYNKIIHTMYLLTDGKENKVLVEKKKITV